MKKNYILLVSITLSVFILSGFLYYFNKSKQLASVPLIHILNNQEEISLVEKTIKENIKKFASNSITVLGGSWYVTSVVVDPFTNSGNVAYEDGHIQKSAHFNYILDSKNTFSITYFSENEKENPVVPVKTTPEIIKFGAPFTINIGDFVSFSDNLVVRLESISDSRCKPDVQCIWAGELSPVLLVSGKAFRIPSDTVHLGTVINNSVTINGYVFILKSATENTATIVVNKK